MVKLWGHQKILYYIALYKREREWDQKKKKQSLLLTPSSSYITTTLLLMTFGNIFRLIHTVIKLTIETKNKKWEQNKIVCLRHELFYIIQKKALLSFYITHLWIIFAMRHCPTQLYIALSRIFKQINFICTQKPWKIIKTFTQVSVRESFSKFTVKYMTDNRVKVGKTIIFFFVHPSLCFVQC